jgi:hypothetical protein
MPKYEIHKCEMYIYINEQPNNMNCFKIIIIYVCEVNCQRQLPHSMQLCVWDCSGNENLMRGGRSLGNLNFHNTPCDSSAIVS